MRVGHGESQKHTGSLRRSRNLRQLRALLAIAAVTPLAVISGCAGLVSAGGSKALTGPAKAGPQQIGVSSASLNLGIAMVGTTAKGTLTITNAGGANLILSLVSVSGGSFAVSGMTTPSTIIPGNSALLTVSFSPTSAGTDSGSISITSNDPKTPTTIITLAGTGTLTPVAPTITTPPANQTVTAGQTASFTVVAGGTAPLSFQWQKNGASIAGATSASYTTAVTTTSDSGSTFRAVVSNTVGTVTSAAANLTVNAVPTPGKTYSISGAITPAAGGSGATVTLSGAATGTTTANNTGNYSFTGLANGRYAITPDRTGYTFSPSAEGVTVSGANVTGINFTATAQVSQTYSISGTITPVAGGSGATVSLSGTGSATTTTNSAGNYIFTGLSNGAYTITPSNIGYTFSPANPSVTVNGTNLANVNFTATTQQAHSVALSWDASTSTVSGYNVYRSTLSGTGYTKINSSVIPALAYSDSTVQNGITYYYVSTAVDSSGNESVYSNETQAIIP